MASHFKKKVDTNNPKLKNLSFLQSSMQQLHTSITTKSKGVASARLNTTTQMITLLEKQQEKILTHLLKVLNSNSPPDLVANVRSQYLENADRLEAFYLDKFFAGASWKFRACVGQGVFLGFKDVSIDNISAGFTLTAFEGKVLFHASSLVVRVSLGELRIKGNKAANMIGQVFKPKWVDLEVTGEIKVPIVFILDRFGKGRWDVEPDGLIFKFHFAKNAQGRVPLPESLINNLVNNFIPKLVTKNIPKVFPSELGPLFMGELNRITVRGEFSIVGKMTTAIWKAPLLGQSEESKAARKLLACGSETNQLGQQNPKGYGLDGQTPLPEACVELITTLAQASTVGKGQVLLPLSLQSMHFYLLSYSGPTDENGATMWEFLLSQWQNMANDAVEAFPSCAGLTLASDWISLMFKRMQELARRQMDINFQVMEMDVSLDVDYCVHIALDAQFKHNTRAGPEPVVVVHTEAPKPSPSTDDKKHTVATLQHELEELREGKISDHKKKDDNKEQQQQQQPQKKTMTTEEGKIVWQKGNKTYRDIIDPIHHIGLTVDCRIHHISNAQGEDDAQVNVNLANVKLAGDLPLITTLLPRFQMEYHLALQAISPSMDIFTYVTPEGHYKCTANLSDPAHTEDCYCYGLLLGRTSIDLLPPASTSTKGLIVPAQANLSLQLLQIEGPLSPLLLFNHFIPHKLSTVFHASPAAALQEDEYQQPVFSPIEPFSETSKETKEQPASSSSLREHPLLQLLCAKAHRIDLSVGMSISLSRRNRVAARDTVAVALARSTPYSPAHRGSLDGKTDIISSPARSRNNSLSAQVSPPSKTPPITALSSPNQLPPTPKNIVKPPPPKDSPPGGHKTRLEAPVAESEDEKDDIAATKLADFITPDEEPRGSDSGVPKEDIKLASSPQTTSKLGAKSKLKNQLVNLSQKGTAVAAAAVQATAHATSVAAAAAARKISGTTTSASATQISSPIVSDQPLSSVARKKPVVKAAPSAPVPVGGWGMLLRLILSPYVDDSRENAGKCLDLQFSYELGELLSLIQPTSPSVLPPAE